MSRYCLPPHVIADEDNEDPQCSACLRPVLLGIMMIMKVEEINLAKEHVDDYSDQEVLEEEKY